MKLMSSISTLVMLLAISGCTSPQIRDHTLLMPANSAKTSKKVTFVIELLPVSVPAQLDIKRVVVRHSDSSMQVLNSERWLGTLGEEMQSALSLQIAQHLGTQDVSGISRGDEKQVVRIRVLIRRFDLWPGNQVRLDADWGLSTRNENKQQRLLCQSQLTLSARGDYRQMFLATQQLVNQLAIKISDTAEKWIEAESASCA